MLMKLFTISVNILVFKNKYYSFFFQVKKHKGNGGWGDKRDHALCRSFSVNTSPEHSMVNNSILAHSPYISDSSFNGSVARSIS